MSAALLFQQIKALKKIENAAEYVIAPYAYVPPGDTIKFVFSNKDLNQINANIGGPP
jgi:hypothetical protein